MIQQRYIPLEAEPIAQEEDLRPWIYAEIQSASNGQINDFTPHSPVVAIVEGQDFANRELRYYMNRYARTIAINHLRIAGIQRRLGSKAQVNLTFTLSASLSNPFVLSKGYLVTVSNQIEFVTKENLVIPAGSISGVVAAEARVDGVQGNVAANTIAQLSQSRAYLKSVTNLEPATGGFGEETIEEVLSRGFSALRYRGTLITADDFEQEIIRQLGFGSVAKAIGGLSSDRVSAEKGAVHVFVLNPDGTQPNTAQISEILNSLQSQVPAFMRENKTLAIASSLHISPIELLPIRINAIASLVPGDNPIMRANEINKQLRSYLKPGNLAIGQTLILKEIENVIRQCGVEFIQSVSFVSDLAVSYSDLALPNDWTAANLQTLNLKLVDRQSDITYEYSL